MKMSQQGIDLLIEREGKRYTVYLDTQGYPTVGVGHMVSGWRTAVTNCLPRRPSGCAVPRVESLAVGVGHKVTAPNKVLLPPP